MRMPLCTRAILVVALLAVAGCDRMKAIGRPPAFTAVEQGSEFFAMTTPGLPDETMRRGPSEGASLWSHGRRSLLGDRRALSRGDILTVVIEIDDRAQISNSTGRSRSSSETMGLGQFFGLPQNLDEHVLSTGATMGSAVAGNSNSDYQGDGSVDRRERLTLRVAATVTEKMPNGVLRVSGSQEVRVNFEMRELLVSGFVRPEDISRQNEVTYDKIAGARISYGGRGQITDVQQPRYGQQAADILLPM
ncbi:flagellar basal body L-ring protein FlgH [Frigidibacter sp. MR17.24]|uniref:flagellar basal body L-ring protein FlgH n=1 Tax=Frigidibacter sp. MR17.24 TaxID=3127345 RepID=UPI003012B471